MRNSLIRMNGTEEVNKALAQGILERNNMLNLKIAELYMPILHSRPSKFFRKKNNATSRSDSLCFGNSLMIKK